MPTFFEDYLVPLAGVAAAGVVLLAAGLWSRWHRARRSRECEEAVREWMGVNRGRPPEREAQGY